MTFADGGSALGEHLSADSIVMHIHERTLRHFLSVEMSVREPFTEDGSESDVISAAAPLEFARGRISRCRSAVAFRA